MLICQEIEITISCTHIVNIFIDSKPEYDTLLNMVSIASIVPTNDVKNRDRTSLESLVVAVGKLL